MTHKFDSGIHDLAVYKYSNFCFVYDLHILDSSGCPAKKDGHLENQKCYLDLSWTPNNIFNFLNVHPFSPGHPLESNMCK